MNIDWVQNLSERKKQVAIGAASVIAGAALLIGYFQSGPNALTYAAAEAAFSSWDASPQDDQLYKSMQEAIRSVPAPVEKGLKQFFSFSYKQEKVTQMILGLVKIVVALFIPFILFGFIGLLGGTSYHYYTRHAQIMSENRPTKSKRGASGDEHD